MRYSVALLALSLLVLAAASAPVWAWYPATDTQGPLTVTIGNVAKVTQLDTPIPVTITLDNKGDAPLVGRLRIGVIDNWRVEGDNPREFSVPANGKVECAVSVIAGRGSYAAHYPIHAYASFTLDGKATEAHAVLVTVIDASALPATGLPATAGELPVSTVTEHGGLPLDRLGKLALHIARDGKPAKDLPVGWTGVDEETGTNFYPGPASRPDQKACIITHPPWRAGVGVLWADGRFALPNVKPIKLTFSTAIRDNIPPEPPSDGVEWRVYVAPEGGEFTQLFERFSLAKRWESAEVDLSAYAGKTITLRLWNGPGPNNDTTCDTGYWAEPTLVAGQQPEPETPAQVAERHQQAIDRARAALKGQTGHFQWVVANAAGKFGVGWAAGRNCFADGALAFATADKAVVFDHFLMSISGENVLDWRSKAQPTGGKAKFTPDGKTTTIMDLIRMGEETVQVETSMFVEKGAFRVRFAMPATTRDKRGDPRFTLLGPGPCDRKAKRVYAGFGDVIQDPQAFTLGEGGFGLSARHVGMDFDNGISLVEASDVFPYQFTVNPEAKLSSLQTGHDATMSFVPSLKGAFAAAKVYRDVSGFKPAGGVAKLQGRMVIDWWGPQNLAGDIRRAAAYGLNDSLFLEHVWQRWGYDYRLPDIYPPACDPKVWAEWIKACKDAGMLCAVHDNYIDFYPDASNFSYKYILFNPDGTPQKAWWNPGPEAQSYRWLPGAYWPWLERNLKLVKEGFAPTGYFIDVFSAIPLLDYYDQEGRFHTKVECGKWWGETFDYVRKTLGDNAPTISEAGHDGLVGHLDGCEADHFTPRIWGWKCADYERTPWHDMASHGNIVLLAGGLGDRYAGGERNANWGSDDYLSNAVMGGRNPMCAGPCTRDTVMTYWLQHDICKQLARQSFDSHEFVGDDIHRQHTVFGGGGEAWVNRGDTPWTVGGHVLPKFGYYARSGDTVSAILLKNGLSVGYASSPGVTFVDTRPDSADYTSRASVKTCVISAKWLGGGQCEAEVEWNVLRPVTQGADVFVHLSHDKAVAQGGERIALYPTIDLDPKLLQQVGVHSSTIRFTIPDDLWDGEYRLRYGLWLPKAGGGRLVPIADLDGSRVRGGVFVVTKDAGKVVKVEYRPEVPPADAPRLNAEGNMIDFGAIRTDGAFRLLHSGNVWKLLPLQGSLAFRAELRLSSLGAAGKKVVAVEGLFQDGAKQTTERFEQTGDVLKLNLNADAFGYRISLK
jgi:hypothetical protein